MSRLSSPLESLHKSIAHAMFEGFPDFHYEDRDHKHYFETKKTRMIQKSRKHNTDDVIVYAMFAQTWSSTALGFGGLGGQAFTDAYTIVLRSALDGSYCVYFGGRFAYRVNRPNELFFEDVKRMRMEEVKTVVELKKYEDDCHAN